MISEKINIEELIGYGIDSSLGQLTRVSRRFWLWCDCMAITTKGQSIFLNLDPVVLNKELCVLCLFQLVIGSTQFGGKKLND